jgi:hypothetical protein
MTAVTPALQVSKTRAVFYIISCLLLSSCGYYSHDEYLGVVKNSAWQTRFGGDPDLYRFKCVGHTITYPSTIINANIKTDALLGIPLSASSSSTHIKTSITEPLQFELWFEGNPSPHCSVNDVSIQLPHTTLKPIMATDRDEMYPNLAYCVYQFPVQQSTVNSFSLQVQPAKLGCHVPKLTIQRKVATRYKGYSD